MDEESDGLALGRFQPLMAELLEDLAANKLSTAEYPNIAGAASAAAPAASA